MWGAEPTRTSQHELPVLRSATLIASAKALLLQNVTQPQVPGSGHERHRAQSAHYKADKINSIKVKKYVLIELGIT